MRNKKGFTLIEVLVALFLTGLVMAGLVGLWISAANFSSSSKQELLYKNMYSVAERKFHQDITESVAFGTGNVPANIINCGGGTTFLTLYKNYSPAITGCVMNRDGAAWTVVMYCYNSDEQRIYREEGAGGCAGYTAPSCSCGSGELVLPGVITAPSSTKIANLNVITVAFDAETKVGRNKRPVDLKFNKSFSYTGSN